MLGLRRPHTSAGASPRMRERERGEEHDTIDDSQTMFWTTRRRAGSSSTGASEPAGIVAGVGVNSSTRAKGSTPTLSLSRSTIFSAEPASKSFESNVRATTAAAHATSGGLGEAQRRGRRPVGVDNLFKDDEQVSGDALWDQAGASAKISQQYGSELHDSATYKLPLQQALGRVVQTARTSSTSTGKTSIDEDGYVHFGTDTRSSPHTPTAPSPSSRSSRPSTSSGGSASTVSHLSRVTHRSQPQPQPSPSLSLREHWYQSYATNSVKTSGPPPPRPPRSAERTRSSPRPSTASGILEGRFFREMMSPTSTSHVRSPPSRFAQPVASPPLQSFKPPSSKSRSSRKSDTATTASSSTSGSHRGRVSNTDRDALEELKAIIRARDSRFTMKGPGVVGKKHHPFSSKDVPFPRYYDRAVLDHEIWENMFLMQLCKSITFHKFDEPPAKVLDLGCGTGSWILNCARVWKKTRFVGLDIVPLHPDLHRVGSTDLAARVQWVQANFLDRLPFPDNEFDFVHVARIARGVPENMWDGLLEEILRVMKPGAAIEVIEEDLYFPGSLSDPLVFNTSSSPTRDGNSSSNVRGLSSISTPSLPSLPLSNSPTASGDLSLPHATSTNSSTKNDGQYPRIRPRSSPGEKEVDDDILGEPIRNKLRQNSSAGSLSRISGELPDKRNGSGGSGSGSGGGGGGAAEARSVSASDVNSTSHRVRDEHGGDTKVESGKNRKSLSPTTSQDSFKLLGVPLRSVSMRNGSSSSSSQSQQSPSHSESPPPLPTSSQAQTNATVSDRPHGRKRSLSSAASRKITAAPSKLSTIDTATAPPPLPVPSTHASTNGSNHSQNQAYVPLSSLIRSTRSESSTPAPDANGDGAHHEKISKSRVKVHPFGLVVQTPHIHKSKSKDNGRVLEKGVSSNSISLSKLGLGHGLGGGAPAPQQDSNVHGRSLTRMRLNGADTAAKQNDEKVLYHPAPRQLFNPRDHSLLERIYTEMHESRFINLTPLALLTNLLGLYFKDVRSHAPISFAFPPQLPGKLENTSRHNLESCDDEFDRRRRSGTVASGKENASSPGSPTLTRRSVHSDTSAKFAQPLFIIDDTRAPAVPLAKAISASHSSSSTKEGEPKKSVDGLDVLTLSESGRSSMSSACDSSSQLSSSTAVSHSTHGTTPSSPSSPERYTAHTLAQPHLSPSSANSRAYRSTNTLPNRTLAFDAKSLHLHLATRVQEVIGCAEAMWEWIQSEQSLAQARERGRRMGGLHGRGIHSSGFGYGSGPYVHGLVWERQSKETDWMSELQAMTNEEEMGDPQMGMIHKLTRTDFDALLSQFEMDMRDNIALDRALEYYLNWKPTLPLGVSPERRLFHTACARWDASNKAKNEEVKRQETYTTPKEDIGEITFAKPVDDGELSASFVKGEFGDVDMPATPGTIVPTIGKKPSKTASFETLSQDAQSTTSADVPMQTRLSRTFRVFAAWKP